MFSAIALAVSDCAAKEKFKVKKEKFKEMKEKFKETNKKKKMYKKKYQECITTSSPTPKPDVTTSSPTPKPPDVPGCYMGGRCNGNYNCCDCEMAQFECDYPPKAFWKADCGDFCDAPSPE